MPDSDRVSIDNLTLAPDLSSNDVAPVVHTVNGVKSTYKATMTLLGTFLNKILQYSADLTTTDKTIIGAINEINTGGGGGSAVILYGTTAPASSLGSDGNLYVQYTEGTGGASDVVDALYVKLDDEWCEISTGGGSGSGGHVIVDEDGTSLTQRANLQFNGAYLEDNSADDTTEVNVVREMTKAQFNQLTADEKTGLINITDESLNATEIPITNGSLTNTKAYIDNGLSDKVDDTDFTADNLPITSGSQTNTKAYIDNIAPKIYNRYDVLLNALNGTLRGFGSAMVTMSGGIARIDFNLKISVDESGAGVTTFGINRDYFTALTGKEITPLAGGVVTYYNNEQVYANRVDFGGTFMQNGQFWQPARVYDDNGTKKVGGWSSHNFASGQRFIGTCYGTYT